MWRSKKLVVSAILVAVVLVGSIGGVVLAADGDDTEPQAQFATLLDKVLAIYEEQTGVAIDREALTDAFAQARDEVRTDALQTRLQSLVEQGKITQAQADECLQWQQAKPDMLFGIGPRAPGGFRGHGGFRGMGGGCGWSGMIAPVQ